MILKLTIQIMRFLPAVLIGIAIWNPAPWAWLAFGFLTFGVMILDRLLPAEIPMALDETASDATVWALVFTHFAVLFGVLWAIATHFSSEPGLTLLLALSTGLFIGQVSNSVAHELIHRPGRLSVFMGRFVYASTFFAHHTTAHKNIHHVYVATPRDPSTAHLGEGFYTYLRRSSVDNFVQGYAIDRERRSRKGRSILPLMALDFGTPVLILVGVSIIWGPLIGLAYLILSAHAQVQLMLSDYVQHYGLSRKTNTRGKLEPVGPQHSWNAPFWMSSTIMLNAPLHGQHHMQPLVTFDNLAPPSQIGGPMLPYNLPTMCTIALIPPLWDSLMVPRVENLHLYVETPEGV